MPLAERRPIVVLAVIATIVLGTVGVGVYGLLDGPGRATVSAHAPAAANASAAPQRLEQTAGPAPAVLPRTDHPAVYARAVAAAIFDWSTASGYSPADYTAPVLADADPSGQELPGLIEDLSGYEPTTEQWRQLTAMQVAQHLRITGARVPSLWPEALAQAHGQLRPGTTAITITGVRERTGVFYGQREASANPVSFTIFEACSPTYRRCHTLRLSQLGDPLR